VIAEGGVIVVSNHLAFAADAWWEKLGNTRLEES
jgi:hypothetical protein